MSEQPSSATGTNAYWDTSDAQRLTENTSEPLPFDNLSQATAKQVNDVPVTPEETPIQTYQVTKEVSRQGQTLLVEKLLNSKWGYNVVEPGNNVDVNIRGLDPENFFAELINLVNNWPENLLPGQRGMLGGALAQMRGELGLSNEDWYSKIIEALQSPDGKVNFAVEVIEAGHDAEVVAAAEEEPESAVFKSATVDSVGGLFGHSAGDEAQNSKLADDSSDSLGNTPEAAQQTPEGARLDKAAQRKIFGLDRLKKLGVGVKKHHGIMLFTAGAAVAALDPSTMKALAGGSFSIIGDAAATAARIGSHLIPITMLLLVTREAMKSASRLDRSVRKKWKEAKREWIARVKAPGVEKIEDDEQYQEAKNRVREEMKLTLEDIKRLKKPNEFEQKRNIAALLEGTAKIVNAFLKKVKRN